MLQIYLKVKINILRNKAIKQRGKARTPFGGIRFAIPPYTNYSNQIN